MARRRLTCTINFEDSRTIQEELRAAAKADARRSVSSILRAAVREYLAKHHHRQIDDRDIAAA